LDRELGKVRFSIEELVADEPDLDALLARLGSS
jgi:hypothetical protein